MKSTTLTRLGGGPEKEPEPTKIQSVRELREKLIKNKLFEYWTIDPIFWENTPGNRAVLDRRLALTTPLAQDLADKPKIDKKTVENFWKSVDLLGDGVEELEIGGTRWASSKAAARVSVSRVDRFTTQKVSWNTPVLTNSENLPMLELVIQDRGRLQIMDISVFGILQNTSAQILSRFVTEFREVRKLI